MQENKKAESETCKEILEEGPRREKERRPFFLGFLFFFSDFGELSQMLRSVYGVRTDHLRLGRGSGWFGENSGE